MLIRHSIKFLFFIVLLLEGCSSKPAQNLSYYDPELAKTDTTNLYALESLHQRDKSNFKIKGLEVNPIRLEGLREAGMTVGAQGALARRSMDLNKMLHTRRKDFDQIFNFRALMLKNDVLPPVIAEGREILNVADPNTLRIADKNYTIIQQAHFTTNPPNWREYLLLDYEKPEVPDPTLLPRPNRDIEIDTWKQAVDQGWAQGEKQANQIFADNLARLKRDYQGMLLYRKLLNENMVSAPIVAKTNLGITGGGNDMTINDQIIRITNPSNLNPRGSEWQPAVAHEITSITAQNAPEHPISKNAMEWHESETTMAYQGIPG